MALTPTDAAALVLLLLIAFAPPLIYLAGVRNLERYRREPWRRVLQAFAWGAVGAVVAAILLEAGIEGAGVAPTWMSASMWLAVIVAPFVEEFAKAIGLPLVRDRDPEPEDGIVYGAAAGFGFAATENLFYQTVALALDGWGAYVGTVVVRTLASALLHGAATAIVGFAIWRYRRGAGGALTLLGYYLLAVAAHAAYNYVADVQSLLAFVLATAFAASTFLAARRRLAALDARAGARPPSLGGA